MSKCFDRIFVKHVVESTCGTDLYAHLVRLEVLEGYIDQLQSETASVLSTSSIKMTAAVGVRPQELVDEVSVGAV